MDTENQKSLEIKITGLVQGVGFRPFVYRLATKFELKGWVTNTNENVLIEVHGRENEVIDFISSLKEKAPPASFIENLQTHSIEYKAYPGFSIKSSYNISNEITEISPDIAVCDECILDMKAIGNRQNYTFVNCTNCGPRFTIIQDLPYDRAKTTMRSFIMCEDCRNEYENILDRRFHAQPTACAVCGPHYELYEKSEMIAGNIDSIIIRLTNCIDHGGVVLMKGLGGMHLACDTFNEKAVQSIRNIKKREGKPFAVMFRDMEGIRQYCHVNSEEEKSILSWKRPIVLLKKKKQNDSHRISPGVSVGLDQVGVMLPYLPFHHLLFDSLKTNALVMTSGNFSSEPILIDNQKSLESFSDHVNDILLHNRPIFNRTDDSVVKIMLGKERVFRRSRGYVPSAIKTQVNCDGILAFGAELSNCFCVGNNHKAILSQHIGDLKGMETTLFYEETIQQFLKLFRVKPQLLAVDMHPQYISTKMATQFPDVPITSVQHHHAHIAACMVEHQLDEKVIGVALDGTGYGTDGHIWGSEFLICDLNEFRRITHFDYIPLPGGDKATEEPWKIAVSYLYNVFGKEFVNIDIPAIQKYDSDKIDLLCQMIDKEINSPLSSGAGRLFDAVASILDLVHISTFQAEGPMRLESLVEDNCNDSYPFDSNQVLLFNDTIKSIVDDISLGVKQSVIATKFHNTIILAIFETVRKISIKENINKVVLSGGVFQNKYLLEGSIKLLQENNIEVFTHANIPTNDGGIALGQLAVASKRRELKCV